MKDQLVRLLVAASLTLLFVPPGLLGQSMFDKTVSELREQRAVEYFQPYIDPDNPEFSTTKLGIGMSTNQTIAGGGQPAIAFDTLSTGFTDTLGEFSAITHQFTAAKAGYYFMYIHFVSSSTDNNGSDINLRTNSTTISQTYIRSADGAATKTRVAGALVPLAKNDTLYVNIYNIGPGVMTVFSDTKLYIMRIL